MLNLGFGLLCNRVTLADNNFPSLYISVKASVTFKPQFILKVGLNFRPAFS